MDYESEHIRRIIALDNKLWQLYNQFLHQAGIHLKRIDYSIRNFEKAPWRSNRNRVVERQIDDLTIKFAKSYKYLVEQSIREHWQLSELKNDSLLMKLIKAAGITIGANQLLRWFNRLPSGSGPVNLGTIAKFDRNISAVEALLRSRDRYLSSRVWDLTGENKQLIEQLLISGISEGRAATKISQDLRSLLQNPDKRFRRVRDPDTGKLKPSIPMKEYHPGRGVYRSSY